MANNPDQSPSADPFEQIMASPGGAAQAAQAVGTGEDEPNPFAAIMPQAIGETSASGAFARGAAQGALPAAGGLAAAGIGVEAGGALGALGGPIGALVGGVVGGIGGGFAGAEGVAKAQSWLLSKLPDSWQESISNEQRADQAEHPVASFLGGLAPYAVTLRPGGFGSSVANLPENATAFQRIMAHPVTGRLFGGAVMGGMELGQEQASHEDLDWRKIALATGFGLVFNKPTKFGEAITNIGPSTARRAFGAEEPTLAPTVAQAGDAKVMGPGITENVFQGTEEQNPTAAMTAQDNARTEQSLIGEPAPGPDIHAVVRQMEPELFEHYDNLVARRDDLASLERERRETGDLGALDPVVDRHILATEQELADIAPQVAAAYRRADESINPPVLGEAPPEAASAPNTALGNPEEQRAYIANDVTQQLVRAGRPRDEAEAAGQIVASRYLTRASRFNGTLGTPQELYDRESAIIKGILPPSGTPASGAPAPTAPLMPSAENPVIAAPATNTTASHIEAIDPSTIGVDANRFQFKAGGNEHGVTERLQGVEQWNPMLAGTALVFRDAQGKNWIADGHQRLGLAQRLMAQGHEPIKLNAFVLNEADGITDADARVIAAAKNIAEGSGSPIDAAKIIKEAREKDIALPQLPPRSVLVRDGQALAQLSPDAFGMAINEVVPTNQAALVGRLVNDPLEQVEAMRLLAKAHPENVRQAELIVRELLSSGTEEMTRQGGLFGEEHFASSVVLERAKIADEAARQLKRDRATFKTLVNEAERIESHGENRLDIGSNQERLTKDEQATQFLTQLATRKGPVSDALTSIAKRFKSGDITSGAAAREFLGVVRGTIESGVDKRADLGGAEPSAAGEREPEIAQDEAQQEFFQRKARGTELTPAELEARGQTVIPGAEALTDAQLAQRRANEALRSNVSQKAMDEGLFGEPGAQQELFQSARGKIRLSQNARPVITLMRDANASTFIHETGHQWLEELVRDAGHEAAPDDLKADAQTVRGWLGNAGEEITTRQHEKFARGFEQYMREGVAPSPRLAKVFGQFKNWLVSIYQTLKGLGKPINEDIRGVFDRLIESEPQRTVIAPEFAKGPTLADSHEADAALTEPHEAGGALDRVTAERDRYVQEQPAEIQNELGPELGPSPGDEPTGEAGGGTGGPQEMVGGSGIPEPVSPGGGGSNERGEVVKGNGNPGAESNGLRGPDQSAQRGTQSASGPEQLAPSPTTLFGSRESPFLDKAGNIRLDNLTNSQDVAQAIRAAADENNEFIGDRRGVVTDGQIMDLADALGMDAAKLNTRKIGQAFNAEQIIAARKLLIQSATEVSSAMKRAAEKDSTDEDVLAYAMAKDRHQMIQGQVAGITAEAGRALRAFRSIAGQETAQGVDQFIRSATGKTLFQLREEAKLGSSLDSPDKVSKFLNDAQKRTFGRMILEYWINGLISGPATHTTYMIGNTILALEKAGPETAAASMIGALRKRFGREGETVRLGEVSAQLKAMGQGIPGGVEAAIEAIRSGVTTRLPGENIRPGMPFSGDTQLITAKEATNEPVTWADVGAQTFGIVRGLRDGFISGAGLLKAGGVEGSPLFGLKYQPTGAIPDIAVRGMNVLPLGTAVRLPSRFIASIHSFFRSVNYSMDKASQAYRIASNEGLSGTAFDARVGEIRQNPSDEVMERARGNATELTLMGKGSQFVQALSRLTNTEIMGFPVLKFIDPFVHIAGNIIDQSIVQRTPVGILAPEIRADLMGKNGNVAQDTAMARMLVGTALSVTFGGLAAEGIASGSGPSKPQDAAMWRLSGNQAHSIRIGDMWYDVHRLGPLGMLMGVSADLYDVAHAAESGDVTTAAALLQHAFTQNILDESFMRGPAELIQAVEDPGRYGEAYIRNFLSSFVPYSVGMAQMSRAADPYSRQARTVMDSIKAKVPGLSESLFPRRDIWGEPMPNREAVVGKGITAMYETQISNDPVNAAMTQLGISPAQPQRKIRNQQLTDQQYDDYSRIAGRMAKMRLDVIVRSPDFQSWPPFVRHDVMKETITQSRETARNMILMKYPSIASAAVQAKLAHRGIALH